MIPPNRVMAIDSKDIESVVAGLVEVLFHDGIQSNGRFSK